MLATVAIYLLSSALEKFKSETERAIITEIDAALQRIEDKTFGICQMTGKPISKARLDAKPWAKYTIEAERIAESSGPR